MEKSSQLEIQLFVFWPPLVGGSVNGWMCSTLFVLHGQIEDNLKNQNDPLKEDDIKNEDETKSANVIKEKTISKIKMTKDKMTKNEDDPIKKTTQK